MDQDQMQRAIEFMIQNQAEFHARNTALQLRQDALQLRQDRFQDYLETLAKLTHDLVTLAQSHSQRLDRLDGTPPS